MYKYKLINKYKISVLHKKTKKKTNKPVFLVTKKTKKTNNLADTVTV